MGIYQQELVYTRLTTTGETVSGVTFPGETGYTINYTTFITLGNVQDTVTVDINGVTGLTFSMVGKIDIPIDSITLRSVQKVVTGATAAPSLGILVIGVKRYNAMFGNSMFG
jgi:hypothetical protein